MKKSATVVALSVIGAALGFGFSQYAMPKANTAPVIAPVFTLKDGAGKTHNLDEWKGKLRLVNFWASWCGPCINEMPLLVSAQKQYSAQGFQVIGPALDDAESVQKIVKQLHINYPVMADFTSAENAAMLLGNAEGALPYSVLIDAQGRVVKTILGGLSRQELDSLIQEHLSK